MKMRKWNSIEAFFSFTSLFLLVTGVLKLSSVAIKSHPETNPVFGILSEGQLQSVTGVLEIVASCLIASDSVGRLIRAFVILVLSTAIAGYRFAALGHTGSCGCFGKLGDSTGLWSSAQESFFSGVLLVLFFAGSVVAILLISWRSGSNSDPNTLGVG